MMIRMTMRAEGILPGKNDMMKGRAYLQEDVHEALVHGEAAAQIDLQEIGDEINAWTRHKHEMVVKTQQPTQPTYL